MSLTPEIASPIRRIKIVDSLQIAKPPAVPELRASAAPDACCPSAPLRQTVPLAWLADRRVLAAAGLAVIGTGLGLGWEWLTAVGIAPLIISAAPCLVMCALGICMMGRSHQASANPPDGRADETIAPTETDPSTR